jgi:hypothetical protein
MSAYLDVRDQIESGDIIAFEVSKYAPKISNFIKLFTQESVYHIGIAVWMYSSEGDRRLFIIQASNGNRQVVPLSLYEDETMQIFAAPVPFYRISDYALARVGKVKYAYLDLVSIWMKEKLRLPVKNWSGEVCTEMIVKIFETAGINIGDRLSTPQTIVDNLVKLGIKQKFIIRKED